MHSWRVYELDGRPRLCLAFMWPVQGGCFNQDRGENGQASVQCFVHHRSTLDSVLEEFNFDLNEFNARSKITATLDMKKLYTRWRPRMQTDPKKYLLARNRSDIELFFRDLLLWTTVGSVTMI